MYIRTFNQLIWVDVYILFENVELLRPRAREQSQRVCVYAQTLDIVLLPSRGLIT